MKQAVGICLLAAPPDPASSERLVGVTRASLPRPTGTGDGLPSSGTGEPELWKRAVVEMETSSFYNKKRTSQRRTPQKKRGDSLVSQKPTSLLWKVCRLLRTMRLLWPETPKAFAWENLHRSRNSCSWIGGNKEVSNMGPQKRPCTRSGRLTPSDHCFWQRLPFKARLLSAPLLKV